MPPAEMIAESHHYVEHANAWRVSRDESPGGPALIVGPRQVALSFFELLLQRGDLSRRRVGHLLLQGFLALRESLLVFRNRIGGRQHQLRRSIGGQPSLHFEDGAIGPLVFFPLATPSLPYHPAS